MGSVWFATRIDDLRRTVALKLPHLAAVGAGLAERMARERNILAKLEHPNIARLYDAGVTHAGRPYLALEFVEREAIDVYCRNRSLDIRTRVKMVVQVAHAVAYAHAHLAATPDAPGLLRELSTVHEQAGGAADFEGDFPAALAYY